MRILIAIPHYYYPESAAPYGSLEKDPTQRLQALTNSLLSLRQTFQVPQCIMHLGKRIAQPANNALGHQIDIIICTTQGRHLLQQLPVPQRWYQHQESEAEPRLLGFECHKQLHKHLGQYDYYGFLEDDLALHDPYFFHKLQWFEQSAPPHSLLQPNRFETRKSGLFAKGYIDGNIPVEESTHLQDLSDTPDLHTNFLGQPLHFCRVSNPHSGCFFLSQTQMQHWASQAYFGNRDTSFVDPMASAATLDITKTFKVYKAAFENAAFLEVEHLDKRFLWQIGHTVALDEASFSSLGFQIIGNPPL